MSTNSGGQGDVAAQSNQPLLQPNGLPTMTPAAGRDSEQSLPCRMRPFAEILNEEKLHRNNLDVKLVRTNETLENGETVKVKTLNEVDLSEFFFDVINLKVDDCLGIALPTERYDTKCIKLKKGVDPTPYLRIQPVLFKGHEITIMKQLNNLTKVTMKNMPRIKFTMNTLQGTLEGCQVQQDMWR